MLSRISNVDWIHAKTISFSSALQIGDSTCIQALSRVLAVQRESDTFLGTEGNYSDYSIFAEPIPFQPIYENLIPYKTNLTPTIKVNKIDLIGVSASSVIHVGNTKNIFMEARVKHIRQLTGDSSMESNAPGQEEIERVEEN